MTHLSLVRKLEPTPMAPSGGNRPLEVLAQRAIAGESEAASQLLRGVLPAVRSACRALLGPSHSELDDAVQNALIAFHRALPSYRFDCSVLHYAIRITFRTIHGFRRRLRLFADRFRLAADDSELNDVRAPLSADAAVLAERSEALRRLMIKLPPVQAEALLLHVALEYPMAEVAAISGVPVNTVKTRLRLAKDSLRRRIERDPTLRTIFGGNP